MYFLNQLNEALSKLDNISSKVYYRVFVVDIDKEEFYEDWLDVLKILQVIGSDLGPFERGREGHYGSITTYQDVNDMPLDNRDGEPTDWATNAPIEYYLFEIGHNKLEIQHTQDVYDMTGEEPGNMSRDSLLKNFGFDLREPETSDLCRYIGPKGSSKTINISQGSQGSHDPSAASGMQDSHGALKIDVERH